MAQQPRLQGLREHHLAEQRHCDVDAVEPRQRDEAEVTPERSERQHDAGLMRRREASINDVKIRETDRRSHWTLGPRPDEHSGLTELGLR
jgi:hypothetical protein